MRIPSKQLGSGGTCYTQRNKENDERKFITGNNEMRRQQNISKILIVKKKKTCPPRILNPVKCHPKTGKIKTSFKHAKVERIKCQYTCTIKIVKVFWAEEK